MNKIASLNPLHLVSLSFVGLLLTIGAFWDFSRNLSDINKLNVADQGVSTCWSRINQTFTALMIKEVNSPYLNRGFLATSDECLGEVNKEGGLLKTYLGKDYAIFSKFISDINWFHEDVLKIHGPMISGTKPESTEKFEQNYSALEDSRLKVSDSIEAVKTQLLKISENDRVLMGAGLLLILLSVTLLTIREYSLSLKRKSHEGFALNLLSSGQAKFGAFVDSLVIEGLKLNQLKITEQIFKDYHENLLEIMSAKNSSLTKTDELKSASISKLESISEEKSETEENVEEVQASKVTLKEVLVSIENIHSKESVQFSDFRDAAVEIDNETCEQIFSSIINKLGERIEGKRKIIISNQIHSDKAIINFFLSGAFFNTSELEFMDQKNQSNLIIDDMNLMILKELALETNAGLLVENKQDKNGKISGMSVKLVLKRLPKDKAKLVSVVRGKKKDLARQFIEETNH